jgi:hypothetical protein
MVLWRGARRRGAVTSRIEALISSLSCRNCRLNSPFARLLGLSERTWQSPNRTAFVGKRER